MIMDFCTKKLCYWLVFVLLCLWLPETAVAGDFSLAGAVAHGEKSSQAYDFYIQSFLSG